MPTNTLTGQDAAVDWAASRRSLGLWLFGAPPLRSRPAADVERSHSICVRFEAAPDAPEVAVVPPVGSVHEPARGTGLRGVSRAHGLDDHTLLRGLVLDRKPQESIGDPVDTFARLLSPLASSLSQVLEALDGYACVELLCQPGQLASELPAPCPRVVSLLPAEPFELLSSLASTVCVSMGLKLRPSSLELRLHPRQVLPKIKLLQDPLSTHDGHRYSTAVDVHPEHVWAFSLRWVVLLQDSEELEVGLHDNGADLPSSPKMSLEPLPSSILGDGQTYSLRINTNAQSRVPSSRGLEAEEAPVESHDHAIDLVGCFTGAPSISTSLAHELGRDAEPLTMLAVGQVVQFGAAFYFTSLDQREALLSHLEKGAISFSELCLFDFGQRECIQDKAFLHSYRVKIRCFRSSDFGGEGSLKVIYKLFKGPLIQSNPLVEPIFGHFLCCLLKTTESIPQFLPQLKRVSLGYFR